MGYRLGLVMGLVMGGGNEGRVGLLDWWVGGWEVEWGGWEVGV